MKKELRILIADDEAIALGTCIQIILSDEPNLKVDLATTPKQCLNQATNSQYDIIVLDISFTPGGREGLSLIKDVRVLQPDADIIMLSSIDDAETKLKALADGAKNYVVKGLNRDANDIISGIKDALATRRFRTESAEDGLQNAERQGAASLSPKMRQVFSLASIARMTKQNVLITGPTGVGKEVIARSISRESQGIPFVVVNCGAISQSLIESELFGATKGSYTGANRDRNGFFKAADGGDIFLDEIANLPLATQNALLRVLQSGEFSRVGSTAVEKVTVRVIAATNEDLSAAVKSGSFREDLLARIDGLHIQIPPLSERTEDIKPIIELALKTSSRPYVTLKPDCLPFLEAYCWPQNIRQLNAVIHSLVALSTTDTLSIGVIPRWILSSIGAVDIHEAPQAQSGPKLSVSVPSNLSFDQAVRHFEATFIQAKFKDLTGSKSITSLAAMLQVSRTTLTRRINDLGIELRS